MKGANSIEEAVGQFYENSNKYSQSSTAPAPALKMSTMSVTVPVNHPQGVKGSNGSNDAQPPAYNPPAYAPPTSTVGRPRHRPHTNPVIEAGNIRARDEVRAPWSLLLSEE